MNDPGKEDEEWESLTQGYLMKEIAFSRIESSLLDLPKTPIHIYINMLKKGSSGIYCGSLAEASEMMSM